LSEINMVDDYALLLQLADLENRSKVMNELEPADSEVANARLGIQDEYAAAIQADAHETGQTDMMTLD